jgi:hypothetical protein
MMVEEREMSHNQLWDFNNGRELLRATSNNILKTLNV